MFERLDPRIRGLAIWHGLPVALWFLLPQRLGPFLWYLSPANRADLPPDTGWAVAYYAHSFVREYHAALPAALLASALLAVGAAGIRRFRPGAAGVFWLKPAGSGCESDKEEETSALRLS